MDKILNLIFLMCMKKIKHLYCNEWGVRYIFIFIKNLVSSKTLSSFVTCNSSIKKSKTDLRKETGTMPARY